ncbi:hypothetical protein IW262DRAFT_343002 [Armillaria fumosa]|nr:hypothetical protein IW262DRAFT_343002 [Armillaria fumosa]
MPPPHEWNSSMRAASPQPEEPDRKGKGRARNDDDMSEYSYTAPGRATSYNASVDTLTGLGILEPDGRGKFGNLDPIRESSLVTVRRWALMSSLRLRVPPRLQRDPLAGDKRVYQATGLRPDNSHYLLLTRSSFRQTTNGIRQRQTGPQQDLLPLNLTNSMVGLLRHILILHGRRHPDNKLPFLTIHLPYPTHSLLLPVPQVPIPDINQPGLLHLR